MIDRDRVDDLFHDGTLVSAAKALLVSAANQLPMVTALSAPPLSLLPLSASCDVT